MDEVDIETENELLAEMDTAAKKPNILKEKEGKQCSVKPTKCWELEKQVIYGKQRKRIATVAI